MKFHKDFKTPLLEEHTVRSHYKNATTRPLTGDNLIGCGEEVEITFTDDEEKKYVGIVESTEVTQFKNITRKMAQNEGYIHEDLLKHEVRHTYPDLKDTDYVIHVVFKGIYRQSITP